MTNLEISKIAQENKEIFGYSLVWETIDFMDSNPNNQATTSNRKMVDAWTGKEGEEPANFVEVSKNDWYTVLSFNQRYLKPYKEPKGAKFSNSHFIN